jgi:hypothetical protein
VADFCGQELEILATAFTSDDPAARALAWQAVLDYHGYENGGSRMELDRREVWGRYNSRIRALQNA